MVSNTNDLYTIVFLCNNNNHLFEHRKEGLIFLA